MDNIVDCCRSKKKTNDTTHQTGFTAKKLVNTFKSSIFCGAKGFLTFNLAFLSYLEHSLHDYTLQKQGKNINQDKLFKNDAAFAMKRNTIPFIEMITIVPFVCFALPAMISGISFLQCAVICAALMVTTCFIVRSFNLRERLLEKYTGYKREEIDKEFTKDSIIYPIFDKYNKRIKYNSPDQGQLLSEKNNTSFLVTLFIFPLKVLQSCILASLAIVELLEAVPNLLFDMVCDRSFEATKSSLQRSGHLLYASMRNIVPITRFDEPIAEFIGTPKACGGCISQ